MRANRPLRAEEICRDYLLAKPGCPDHLRLLSHALMKQKRLDEAEQQVRFAIVDFDPIRHCSRKISAVFSRCRAGTRMRFPGSRKQFGWSRACRSYTRNSGRHWRPSATATAADQEFRGLPGTRPDKEASRSRPAAAGRALDEAVATLKSTLQDNPGNVDAMRYLAGAYFRGRLTWMMPKRCLRQATQRRAGFPGRMAVARPRPVGAQQASGGHRGFPGGDQARARACRCLGGPRECLCAREHASRTARRPSHAPLRSTRTCPAARWVTRMC